MVPSKRKEPFRYVFSEPQPCVFQLTSINGMEIAIRDAEAVMIDFHKSGCKLRSPLNLNADTNRLLLNVKLTVDGEALDMTAEIRWQLAAEPDEGYLYGVRFDLDEWNRERLMALLRRLAGEKRISAV